MHHPVHASTYVFKMDVEFTYTYIFALTLHVFETVGWLELIQKTLLELSLEP